MRETGQVVLDVRDLRTYFFTQRGVVKAVDGISFTLRRGETLGLVGESGCGKSITCLSLLRLVPKPAGKIVGGQIQLLGEDLLGKSETEMRSIRGRLISMILQDPMTSLNPVFSTGYQLAEAIQIHQHLQGESLWAKAKELLELVKIPSAEIRLKNYPHELSGGMRQRVVGAIAVSCRPVLLIADEPTTSLDATIQAQYLTLLKEVQRDCVDCIILVTHDFGIVASMCDRVAVMYAGRIIESGPVMDIFDHPAHPYTRALLRSVPRMEGRKEQLYSIAGQPPAMHDMPEGCRFRPRCSECDDRCQVYPQEVELAPGHSVSCWKVR